jgi:hypothetical protein
MQHFAAGAVGVVAKPGAMVAVKPLHGFVS